MVVLSHLEEMVGRRIKYVSTGSRVINIGFDDNTFYSIKTEEHEWDAKEHLKRTQDFREKNAID